jgi:predicted metal-binding membrane protein
MSESTRRWPEKLPSWLALAAIIAVAGLCWRSLLGMDMMALMVTGAWQISDWRSMLAMWSIMMIAMMLPSAIPMLLLFTAISPKRQPQINPATAFALFSLGYLLAWIGFSIAATILQWQLQRNALLSAMLEPTSRILSAVILIVSGIYQLTPLKHRCLQQCRNPVQYLTARWRTGLRGSLEMGLDHGVFCIGCCWALMLLLFAGGVMNLLVIAAIAIMVLIEKVLPLKHTPTMSGLTLILAGTTLYWRSLSVA